MQAINRIFFTVVKRGRANAILQKAVDLGATGGTIFMGEGTSHSRLSNRMGLPQARKEVLMVAVNQELDNELHQALQADFKINKKGRGIAFTIPFQNWQHQNENNHSVAESSYYCLITIVDRGKSVECVKSARAAGATGGTLVHGRGAGVPANFYFPLEIEPQKDIVFIIADRNDVARIRTRIYTDLHLDEIGNGILFVLPITQVSGFTANKNGEARR